MSGRPDRGELPYYGGRRTVTVDLDEVSAAVEDLLERYVDSVVIVAAQFLENEAEEIMAAAKERFVPVDTGNLKNSGVVYDAVTSKNGASVEMGFGGPAARYALIVHEDPDAFHAPPTQWKYLETPTNEAAAGLPGRMIEMFNRVFS